jgi:hypothetical protein
MDYEGIVLEVEARFKYRADRGVKALADRYAGYSWVASIDLATLDMSNCKDCLLGQLFGDYYMGLNALGLPGGTAFGFMEDPGFFFEYGMSYEEQYAILTRVWVEELRKLV